MEQKKTGSGTATPARIAESASSSDESYPDSDESSPGSDVMVAECDAIID